MISFEKSEPKDVVNKISSHKEEVFLDGGAFHVTQHLSYRQASVGVGVYVPKDVQCILILEPVRNLKLKTNDENEFTINCVAGTVCVIPADQAIVITWPQPVYFLDVKLNNSHFAANLNFFDVLKIEKLFIFSSKRCLQIGKIISENLETAGVDDIDFMKSLYNVISNLIVKGCFLSQESSVHNAGLSAYACRQIENHLKENFRDSISVSDMANYLGMSSGHFASCFRESFGETPHQYLLNLRLDDAEKRLKETDIPISEIAASLNFSSQSHLTTALKKYRLLTPGEIRRRSSFKRRQP